ncbi:N-acetylglucosamine kinase [Parafrigoribacterium soli]|uniref:N-acetylglucosamine kinase n=1 Tax=Parafrigoribacterium soli TaxID=3144663 RepID=UPI0032EC022D
MPTILAMDAGGTSTRAVTLDATGRCLGYGRAGTGNPTAAGIDHAVDQLALAAEGALGGQPAPGPGSFAVISLAGSTSAPFTERLSERLSALGFAAAPILQPDLLGTYFSGTIASEGSALIAGTGAVAGRIAEGRLDFTRGGTGWLLGDDGSGFWIGQRVARAVVADLDGLGPATVLTARVLASFAIEPAVSVLRGRPFALIRLMEELYALRPVDLARLAPLAFGAAEDPVARDILAAAADALAQLLAATRGPDDGGPIVLGGSILAAGMRVAPEIFEGSLADAACGAVLVPVVDGVVGAAMLGLREAGIEIDDALFSRVNDGVTELRAITEAA